jgi:hypothetical protein
MQAARASTPRRLRVGEQGDVDPACPERIGQLRAEALAHLHRQL